VRGRILLCCVLALLTVVAAPQAVVANTPTPTPTSTPGPA